MDSYYLLANKPVGVTSQKHLTSLKRQLGIKKIGHHGTLDPFADGLLLVGVNQATKYFQFLNDEKKVYEATLKLGVATDTLDCDGAVTEEKPVANHSADQIQNILDSFLGQQEQVPPMYSAIKHEGKRLYELARAGQVVERKSRVVTIHEIGLQNCELPIIKFRASVSRGTYIRVLAQDIASRLGSCGHLIALRRTELCGKSLADCEKPLPIDELLQHYPSYKLSDDQARSLMQGKVINVSEIMAKTTCHDGLIFRLYAGDGFLGLGQVVDDHLKSLRLMAQ